MPELPDIEVYIDCLRPRILGATLERVRVASPFLVRTFDPPHRGGVGSQGRRAAPHRQAHRHRARGRHLWLVLHLMIAGRLHWREKDAKLAGKYTLAAFDFADGALVLTEAGAKRRAVAARGGGRGGAGGARPGRDRAAGLRRGRVRRRDPRLGPHAEARARRPARLLAASAMPTRTRSCIAAKLSPVRLARTLSAEEAAMLHRATLRRARGMDGNGCATRRGRGFPRRSRPSARASPCTGAIASPARAAARRCSASCMATTRPTTARTARPAGGS